MRSVELKNGYKLYIQKFGVKHFDGSRGFNYRITVWNSGNILCEEHTEKYWMDANNRLGELKRKYEQL